MTETKVKHYQWCRDELEIKLTDAKEVVDRLAEAVDLRDEPYRSGYENEWERLQEERRREKRKRHRERRNRWARSRGTVIELNLRSGETAAAMVNKPLAEMVMEAGVAWTDEPIFAYEEYTFGNINGAAILEVIHELLDGQPISWVEPNKIEYLKLRSACP
jgi:hypothetical protein